MYMLKKKKKKKIVGKMWSGGARDHYASEISDRKLPSTSPLIPYIKVTLKA